MQVSMHENKAQSHDHDHHAFERLVQQAQNHLNNRVDEFGGVVFTTDIDPEELFEAYLNGFDSAEQRQIHNCNCCRQFFRNYGGLVFINEKGSVEPAVWPTSASGMYADPVKAVRAAVKGAKVNGVFRYEEKTWKNTNGSSAAWTHFRLVPQGIAAHRDRLKTPFQAMAEKREDFSTVMRALHEFLPGHVDTAVTLLEGNQLYRSEKILGQAQWLQKLHKAMSSARTQKAKANVVWREVAVAPAGFCHPRSGVIGTLLEDIAAGMAFDQVKRRFDDKMNPTQYQRPQAAPAVGNVAQAEKLVEKLGVQRSLRRRFAALSEVRRHALWGKPSGKASPVAARESSVFGHVETKNPTPQRSLKNVPEQAITWSRFARTVLPRAVRIEYMTDKTSDNFCAFVTATHADAPPILQWDLDDARNPVSWYLYVGGSAPSRWNLPRDRYVEVEAILPQPNLWSGDGFPHQGNGVLLVLKDARDSGGGSVALFPETLRSEFHQIRSTIEAYSRSTSLDPAPREQLASGVKITESGKKMDFVVRVTTDTTVETYRIDRWD